MEGGCDPTRPLPCTSAYSLGYVGKERGSHEPQGRVVLLGQCLLWAERLDASFCLCFPQEAGTLSASVAPLQGWEDGSGAAMQVCDYFRPKTHGWQNSGSLAGLASELGCGAHMDSRAQVFHLCLQPGFSLGTGPRPPRQRPRFSNSCLGSWDPRGPEPSLVHAVPRSMFSPVFKNEPWASLCIPS